MEQGPPDWTSALAVGIGIDGREAPIEWRKSALMTLERVHVFDEARGQTVEYVHHPLAVSPLGYATWWGVSVDNPHHDLLLTAHGGQLVGDLIDGGGTVRIAGDGNGVRMAAVPEHSECGVDLLRETEEEPTPRRAASSSLSEGDSDSEVGSTKSGSKGKPIADVLVVFTTDALIEYTTSFPGEHIEVEIAHHIAGVNAAFDGSGIYGGVRLVGVRALDWGATGLTNVNDIMDALAAPTDNSGNPNIVHTWRDDVGADLVMGVVDTNGTGSNGTGQVQTVTGPNTDHRAFSVVRLLDLSRSTAHELAHNAGAGHDRDDDPCDTGPDYRNAFSWPDPETNVQAADICAGEPFTTKMGNVGQVVIGSTPFNTPKIHRFSNPSMTITRSCTTNPFPRDIYLGNYEVGPEGCTADNERIIEANWPAIAEYRPQKLLDHGLSSHNGGEDLSSGPVSFTWNPTGVSGSATDITVWTPTSNTLPETTMTHTPNGGFPPNPPVITFPSLPTNEVVALRLDIQAVNNEVVSVEYRFNNATESVSCGDESRDFIVTNDSAGGVLYENASCAPLGTDVCAYSVGNQRWICDTKQSGVTSAHATMIGGIGNGHTYDYAAYGFMNTGFTVQPFCCMTRDPGGAITSAYLYGTEGDDTLQLVDNCEPIQSSSGGAETTCGQMMEIDADPLQVRVYGRGGDDAIFGSDRDTADYTENLRGNAGDDTIIGNGGDDILYGWADDDVLLGGAGDDLLEGGWENDWMDGGPGTDELRGDNGDDVLVSRHGSAFFYDDMFGETGNDSLCARYRETYMVGSPASSPASWNLLWYNYTPSVINTSTQGNANWVVCGDSANSTFGDCDFMTLTTPPTGCLQMGFDD